MPISVLLRQDGSWVTERVHGIVHPWGIVKTTRAACWIVVVVIVRLASCKSKESTSTRYANPTTAACDLSLTGCPQTTSGCTYAEQKQRLQNRPKEIIKELPVAEIILQTPKYDTHPINIVSTVGLFNSVF